MSLTHSMMLKRSFIFRRCNLISFIRSWLFPLFQSMMWILIIKQLVYVKTLLIIEVVDAHLVVKGVVEAAYHLEINLLVNFVENMVLCCDWLLTFIWWSIHSCSGSGYTSTFLSICMQTNLKLPRLILQLWPYYPLHMSIPCLETLIAKVGLPTQVPFTILLLMLLSF